MNTDLKKLFIRACTLTGTFKTLSATSAPLGDMLLQHQKAWPRKPVQKLGVYEVDQTKHHMLLQLSGRKGSADSITFGLQVHPIPSKERIRAPTLRRLEGEMAAIAVILNSIGELNLQTNLHGHVDWTFPPDSYKTIISLPLLSVSELGLPFQEIAGLRLRKGKMSVILDLQEDRSLQVAIWFPFTEPISNAVPSHVVDEGMRLLSRFVTKT